MPDPIQCPKGVAEYVPPASDAFLRVQAALAAPAVRAGYEYIELPVFEDTSLFERGVGEGTDIVGKEMYTFTDRGGRSLSLRPEGTAGVVRSVIQHGLTRAGLPVKLWYAGPFFRAERPQRGRFRQFSQVGVEAIGLDDPALDAEIIALADASLRRAGLKGHRLVVNSLGDARERPAYRDELAKFVRGLTLDPETLRRAEANPLRLLDDKRSEVRALLENAPVLRDFLSEQAREHHAEVLHRLDGLGVGYTEDPHLVRGLDYYTRTTFEFVHDGLGAQAALGGGGRYDGLMAALGGEDTSGVGHALGIDRVMLAAAQEGLDNATSRRVDVFMIPIGPRSKDRLFTLMSQLRAADVSTDLAFGDRSMKGSMRAADRAGARIAVIVGERELAADRAVLKDLATGEQRDIPLAPADSFVAAVAAALATATGTSAS